MSAARTWLLALPVWASLAVGSADAQEAPRVTVTLSSPTATVGSDVVLQVVVETGGGAPEIEMPALPAGLEVVGSREQTDLQFTIPGGRRRTVRREVVLRPEAPGTYQIPPVRVRAGGATREGRPLFLVVTGTSPGAGVDEAPGGDVLLRASLSADTVYVGQQVTLTVEAMVSEEVRSRLRRAPEYVPPEVTGFWRHEFPRERTLTRVLGNRRYEVQAFRRAYFPISPGSYEIPPARLTYEVRGGFLAGTETFELSTDPLRLVVLPVPEAGRPGAFTGAVGRFDVRASVAPVEVAAGEPVTLTVEVRGEGNVRALPPPALPQLRGARIYPPGEEADAAIVGGTVRGVKRFEWVVVPERSGVVELPILEYGYFDPADGRFHVATAAPSGVRVRGETSQAPVEVAIRPVRSLSGGRLDWVRSPGFAALQLAPLAALLWAVWRRRRLRPRRPASSRRLRSARLALLAELDRMAAGDGRRFLDAARDGSRRWLAARLGRSALLDAGARELSSCLEDHGVDSEVADMVATLLERIQHARYEAELPTGGVRAGIVRELSRLLAAVDRQATRTRPASGAGAATAAVLAVVAGLAVATGASPHAATAAPIGAFSPVADGGAAAADPFVAALAALEAGDARAAAAGFFEAVQTDPRSADGWYNLGTACYAAGRPGCALWGWLVTLRIRPRDSDARHNLEVAGAPPELIQVVSPPLRLSAEETLLLVSLAWFLALGFVAVRYVGRRPFGRWPALAAATLGLLVLVNWSVPQFRRAAAVVLDPHTTLHAAPNRRAEVVTRVDPGEVVRLVELGRRNWARVQGPDGQEGWVEEARLGWVGPRAPDATPGGLGRPRP